MPLYHCEAVLYRMLKRYMILATTGSTYLRSFASILHKLPTVSPSQVIQVSIPYQSNLLLHNVCSVIHIR